MELRMSEEYISLKNLYLCIFYLWSCLQWWCTELLVQYVWNAVTGCCCVVLGLFAQAISSQLGGDLGPALHPFAIKLQYFRNSGTTQFPPDHRLTSVVISASPPKSFPFSTHVSPWIQTLHHLNIIWYSLACQPACLPACPLTPGTSWTLVAS